MKQPQKIGNGVYTKLLYLYVSLVLVYIVITVSFHFNNNILSLFPPKPIFLCIVKWIYGLLMIIGILRIRKQPNLGWILVNSVSVCVLLQWHISFEYYTSDFDKFLLEFVSLALIITTNLKSFLETYSIERVLKARKEISNKD